MKEAFLAAALISNATTAALFALLLLLIILGLIAYAVGLRNDLVKMRNNIDKSFAGIDMLLKQRHDELPKLLETCRPYLEREQDTLRSVVDARNAYTRAASPRQKAQADQLVSGAVRNLLAVALKNPNLKNNASFVQLQARITQLREKVATERDRYNESVNSFNARLVQVPHAFVARLAKLRAREPFQAGETNDK
jgi:LemA protein